MRVCFQSSIFSSRPNNLYEAWMVSNFCPENRLAEKFLLRGDGLLCFLQSFKNWWANLPEISAKEKVFLRSMRYFTKILLSFVLEGCYRYWARTEKIGSGKNRKKLYKRNIPVRGSNQQPSGTLDVHMTPPDSALKAELRRLWSDHSWYFFIHTPCWHRGRHHSLRDDSGNFCRLWCCNIVLVGRAPVSQKSNLTMWHWRSYVCAENWRIKQFIWTERWWCSFCSSEMKHWQ